MKTTLLFSALMLGAMTTVALAEAPILTDGQLDRIVAGANQNSRDTVTYLGSSDNVCTSNCDVPGRTTTSSNKGNPTNTNCNSCGTTGPGNN
jgi:hypothetical protein